MPKYPRGAELEFVVVDPIGIDVDNPFIGKRGAVRAVLAHGMWWQVFGRTRSRNWPCTASSAADQGGGFSPYDSA